MKNIQTALEAITVGNGYSNTLNAVERFMQGGQSHQPPMAVVKELSDDVIGQQPLGYVSRTLNVGVGLVVQQDDAVDARSASEVMNSLIADIQKKMNEDIRRGDLATNTEETGVREIEIDEGQPNIIAVVDYRISYRHLLTDPTVVG